MKFFSTVYTFESTNSMKSTSACAMLKHMYTETGILVIHESVYPQERLYTEFENKLFFIANIFPFGSHLQLSKELPKLKSYVE